MKKILIYKHVIPNGEYDIYNPIDYTILKDTVNNYYEGISPNWANRLWLQAIISEIYDPGNLYEFLTDDMTVEYINNNFDLIVLPMANIFWTGYIKTIISFAEFFEKINIPTYVIACGVQADSYDSLDEIVENLKDPSKRFINAIYRTGGEFALRGYFTKRFFDAVCKNTAVVTGCPSLYQCGRNLKIEKNSALSDITFKPVLNGELSSVYRYFNIYKNAMFFDQCNYFQLLYGNDSKKLAEKRSTVYLINKYGYEAVRLTASSKLKLYPEMDRWQQYLKNEGFNFSFGSRIHGNIMSILVGIPAVVWTCDSRTREMTEFFDIPAVTHVPEDLLDLYNSVDYTKFNKHFKERYDAFESFLKKNEIVNQINENNLFFNKTYDKKMGHCVTINDAVVKSLEKYEKIYRTEKIFYNLARHIVK